MLRKVRKNTAKTKNYLDSLPKIYGVFLWAKWGILELSWTGKYNKAGIPLVYTYYDGNGCCDEYRLMPIVHASSGAFYGWYSDKAYAEAIRDTLNTTQGSPYRSPCSARDRDNVFYCMLDIMSKNKGDKNDL